MKKSTQLFLTILNLLLLVVSFVISIYCVIHASFRNGLVMDIATLIALIFSAIYVIKGYTKSAAASFKIFMNVYAIQAFLFTLYFTLSTGNVTQFTAPGMIIFGCLCVMCEVKDYGKVNSKILGLCVLLFSILIGITCFVEFPGIARGGTIDGTMKICRISSVTTLAIVMNIMIAAKYADKESRGSK